MSKNKKYTGEFKEKVVKAYLSGLEGGPIVLARKYGISSATQIKVWTKKYTENPKIKLTKNGMYQVLINQS